MRVSDSPPATESQGVTVAVKVDIAVIGAGQAGLSSAYHLTRLGLQPDRHFTMFDRSPGPGGAWQFRWPSLTLSAANRIHDLPGLRLAEVIDVDASGEVQAASLIPQYYRAYEQRFGLRVHRPIEVKLVCDRGERLRIETSAGLFSVRGIINATGTWETPVIPDVPGKERFRGRQLHTKDYRSPEEFAGQHVIIVGAGISAIQLLDEISQHTRTTWVTRREPQFRPGPFTEENGRAAVALVEERVRQGLPPASVVSVTGIPLTPRIEAMRERGVL